jgi:hypothetical protein
MPRAKRQERPELGEPERGQVQPRQRRRHVAHRAHAARRQVERHRGQRGERHANERPRHLGRELAQGEHHRERAEAHAERERPHLAEPRGERGHAPEEAVGRDGHARGLAELARQQREPDARDVAHEHRPREQLGQKAQTQQRPHDRQRPHQRRERRHERHVASRITARERAHAGGREDGRAGLGPHAEVARAAHEGVRHQRGERRVKACRRRQPRELGVGHRLRQQHGAHREPRHQIGPQPRTLVASQQREARQATREPGEVLMHGGALHRSPRGVA